MSKELLKETLFTALNDQSWLYALENTCRHGCCPTQYSYLSHDMINEFITDFINELEYREAENGKQ